MSSGKRQKHVKEEASSSDFICLRGIGTLPATGHRNITTISAIQLTELLTEYGDIFYVWFDNACGEGLNGRKQVYDFPRYIEMIRNISPMRLFLTISDRISGGVATKPVNRDIPNGRSSRPNCVIWAGCRRVPDRWRRKEAFPGFTIPNRS